MTVWPVSYGIAYCDFNCSHPNGLDHPRAYSDTMDHGPLPLPAAKHRPCHLGQGSGGMAGRGHPAGPGGAPDSHRAAALKMSLDTARYRLGLVSA